MKRLVADRCCQTRSSGQSTANTPTAYIVGIVALLLIGCSQGEPAQGSPAKPDASIAETTSQAEGVNAAAATSTSPPDSQVRASGNSDGSLNSAPVPSERTSDPQAKTLEQMQANLPKEGSLFRIRARVTDVEPNLYESRSYSDDTYVQKQYILVGSLDEPITPGSTLKCNLKDTVVPFPVRIEQEVVIEGTVSRLAKEVLSLGDCVIISMGQPPAGIPDPISVDVETLKTLEEVASAVEEKLKKNGAVEHVANWGEFGITLNKFSSVEDLRDVAVELNKYPLAVEVTLNGPFTTESLEILSTVQRISDISLMGDHSQWSELSLDPLTQLRHLERVEMLRVDGLSDQHLVALGKCHSLRTLSIIQPGNSHVTVKGWAAIAEIPWLRSIYGSVAIPGEDLPELMPKFQRLRRVSLNLNKLPNGSCLTACPELSDLSITGADLSTESLVGISKCKSLRSLSLSRCRVEGDGPLLDPTSSIKSLSFAASQVSESALQTLPGTTSLETVTFQYCDQIPAEAQQAVKDRLAAPKKK